VGNGELEPNVEVGLAPLDAPALDVACGVGDPDCRGCGAGRVTTNNVADASAAAARPTLAQSLGSLMFANSSRPAQPPEGSLAQGEAGKHVRETPSV
jgi:hypothetical protein